MIQIINFLDTHSGSLTFLVTAVYVVATIFICWANIKSERAMNEQIKESQRQFDEENRAYITYEFIFERWTLYGIRFTNHGKHVAQHIHIQFTEAFTESLSKTEYAEALSKLSQKECLLGVGQSIDVYFGGSEFKENRKKLPIEGKITYSDRHTQYEESFFIDFNNYSPVFTVDSSAEDIRREIEKQTQAIAEIRDELCMLRGITEEEKENA